MRTAAPLLIAALSGLAVLSAGSPTAAAPVPKHLMKAGDDSEQGKLQGRWKLTGIRLGDQDLLAGGGAGVAGLDMTLEFRGDELTAAVKQAGNDQTMTAKTKFDTAGGVKRVLFSDAKRVGNGPAGAEKDGSFGYVLDGDTLKLATRSGGDGADQATDPANPGKNTIVMVFSRVKPEPGK